MRFLPASVNESPHALTAARESSTPWSISSATSQMALPMPETMLFTSSTPWRKKSASAWIRTPMAVTISIPRATARCGLISISASTSFMNSS